MSRVPHRVPMRGYDHVTHLLMEAGGPVVSKKEAKALVAQLEKEGRGTEALAAKNIFTIIDARDAASGHRVTEYDFRKDRRFVQASLLENRDRNRNGYSADERADLSPTGRALMELGQTLGIKRARGRVALETPERGLFHIATLVRQAAKADLITGRGDINGFVKQLLAEGRGTEALAVQTFFGFLDHRDARPGARITDADITQAIDYGRETLLAKKDRNHNGYSKEEVDEFSTSAKAFLLIGKMIEAGIIPSALPIEGAALRRTLAEAVSGQQFDQMGSEGGQALRAVHRDGQFTGVNLKSFRKAFDMPERPLQVFEGFKADDLRQFIEVNAMKYERGGARLDPTAADRAFATTAILRSLKDLKVIVTGEGDQGLLATYIVGLAPDKSMVGIQTGVVWT